MRVLFSTQGPQRSRGDVDPLVGLAVPVRALQARGAATPVSESPDCAELLARGDLPLVAGNVSMMPAMLSRAG
jgi:hypothetical protein